MPSFALLTVTEVKAVGPASLWIRFSDGAEGTVDLSGSIPPAFSELSSHDYFARVSIAGGPWNGRTITRRLTFTPSMASTQPRWVGISGGLPRQRQALLLDWRDQHRDELMANWNRMCRGQPPVPIEPMEYPRR